MIAVALLLIALLAPAARSPAADSSADANRPRKHLRFINRGDIFTLDLNQMSYMQDFRLTYAIREGLYAPIGPKFEPMPAGATSVNVSPDKTIYTFHLRPEAKWSNGDRVTAHDYVFSWFRLLEDPGEYTYLFYPIKGAEEYQAAFKNKQGDRSKVGIEAVDDLTLRVTLRQPLTYMLDLVAFAPFYPRHEPSMRDFAVRENPEDPSSRVLTYKNQYTRPPHVVTNGPFKLVDWKFKRYLRLERNEHYWDLKNVKLDAIDNLINENMLSQYLQFEAGAADWIAEVPPDIAPELRVRHLRDGSVPELQSATAFGTAFLTLYCKPELPKSLGSTKNPMADVRVRQALALAIDKKFITEGITRMGEKVALTYIPPGTLPGFTSKPGWTQDVKRAQQLLAEAGYPNGQGFPRLPILYNSENRTRERMVQALQQQWKQALGIDVQIEGIEGKIFRERVSKREFAIATVAWFGDYPDVSTFTDKYRSTSLQNDSAWETPAYDALLDEAAKETDETKRFEILARAEAMLNTEFPIIPIYHYVNSGLISKRLKGVEVNARMMIRWKEVDLVD